MESLKPVTFGPNISPALNFQGETLKVEFSRQNLKSRMKCRC